MIYVSFIGSINDLINDPINYIINMTKFANKNQSSRDQINLCA